MSLYITKFKEEDFYYYFSLVSNEKVMAQITERAIPYDEAQAKFARLLDRNRKHEVFGSFKVFESFTNEFIGLGHLLPEGETSHTVEIGYMLLPDYWGRGYGTLLARVLTDKARELGVKSLKALIDPENAASRKILVNLGFVSEQVGEWEGLPAEVLTMHLDYQQKRDTDAVPPNSN